MRIHPGNIRLKPVLFAMAAMAVMVYAIQLFQNFDLELKKKQQRDKLLENLILKKSRLEKALYSRIYYTRSVAAVVAMNPGITNETYYRLAAEFIQGDSVISTMALSRNCKIGAIYPLEGHETALGLDLLSHPKRKQIVEETVRTRKTFIAGPVELVEGGIAFISYTPIFEGIDNGGTRFWGVTDIVIYRDRLFNEAGLKSHDADFSYVLKGYDGRGEQGGIFWGDSTVFVGEPVSIAISLPTGSWILAAAPSHGWSEYVKKDLALSLLLYACALIISILIWILAANNIRKKEQDEELRKSAVKLKELNATKDKLFSVIAHDLRNPFSVFLGYTEMLTEDLSEMKPDEVRTIAVSMRKSATNMFRLLEDLLEWSRLQQGQVLFAPSELQLRDEVYEGMGQLEQAALLKNVKFSNDIDAGVKVKADKAMLQTILRNMLSNAVKFTPRGGSVSISAEKAEGSMVRIFIRDTGIGISQDMIGDLFFLNGSSNRKGTDGEPSTGLGLIICREFVEKHGGTISVESNAGEGSVFSFTVPSS